MWTAHGRSGSRLRCGTVPTRPRRGWADLTRTARPPTGGDPWWPRLHGTPDFPVGRMTSERPSARVDFDRPSIARVFDALMGGQDNYEADRAVLRQILEI